MDVSAPKCAVCRGVVTDIYVVEVRSTDAPRKQNLLTEHWRTQELPGALLQEAAYVRVSALAAYKERGNARWFVGYLIGTCYGARNTWRNVECSKRRKQRPDFKRKQVVDRESNAHRDKLPQRFDGLSPHPVTPAPWRPRRSNPYHVTGFWARKRGVQREHIDLRKLRMVQQPTVPPDVATNTRLRYRNVLQ